MSSKAMRLAAIKGAKRWQQLRFNTLNKTLLPSALEAELRLPIQVGSTADAPNCGEAGVLRLALSTNSTSVLERVRGDVDAAFFSPSPSRPRGERAEDKAGPPVIVDTTLNVHVGAPKDLGLPAALEMESQNWVDGVMRGEDHAYAHVGNAVEHDDGTFTNRHPRYMPSIRWLDQLLLDGFVSRRVDARTGYTTASVLHAHEQARWFGKQLPPFHLSPYYSANELMSAWCLFSKNAAELFSNGRGQVSPAGAPSAPREASLADHHVHRATELALASAFLPSLQGVWLHGAVLSNSRTGDLVWIAGPRHCGKTTLALHALAAMPDVQMTAAETFWLASGAVQPHWEQPLLFASVPAPVEVGLGAVLGTLHPNPALAAAVQEHHALPAFTQSQSGMAAFLRNSDAQIWNMSISYPLSLSKALPSAVSTTTRWSPAVAGRLKAVVLLDWGTEALASTAQNTHGGRVGRAPLSDPATWRAFQESFTDERALFKSHYLIRSVYDDTPDSLWARLESLLHPSDSAAPSPELYVMTGSVDFQRAVDVIDSAFKR